MTTAQRFSIAANDASVPSFSRLSALSMFRIVSCPMSTCQVSGSLSHPPA
jgi:hypothetical protein